MKLCVAPTVLLLSLMLSPMGCLYELVEDTSVDRGDDTAAPDDTATDDTGSSDTGSDDSGDPDPEDTDTDSGGDSGGDGLDCSDLPVCDDFEGDSVGSAPSTSRWTVETPHCSGDGSISVDTTVAHSGSNSVRISGSGGYCNHVFIAPTISLEDLGDEIHGRFFVRFDDPLGMQHVTFLALHDSVQDKDLRMGGQSSILMWNRESDDATLPELSPTGIAASHAPAADSWVCVEFALNGPEGTIHTWVDGALIDGLVVDGVKTNDVDNRWLDMDWSPNFVDVRFGWESYGGVNAGLWFDDIAMSSEPIGCE